MDLDKIDTSHWLNNDKEWLRERSSRWAEIERVVGLNRKKSEVKVIERYYFYGELPNWEKYRDWEDIFRPFDLNIFLWLHPSSDPGLLQQLYQSYVESDLTTASDVITGYGSFLGHELVRATAPYKSLEEYPFPFMGNKNIIVFRIMFGDLDYAKTQISAKIGKPDSFDNQTEHIFEFLGYEHFLKIRRWLLHDKRSPLSLNCLYQYDEVSDWILTTITRNTEIEFRSGLESQNYHKPYLRALYCIHHFDTEKDGDTSRARAIRRIRKILDKHEFINEFREMWEAVKAGKVEVVDPWKIQFAPNMV